MKKTILVALIVCLPILLFANVFTGKVFEVKSGAKEYKNLEFQFLDSEILVCNLKNGTYAKYPYQVSGSTIVLGSSAGKNYIELFNKGCVQYKISDGAAKVELSSDEISLVLYDSGRKQYRSDLAFELLDKTTIASALVAGSRYSVKNQKSKESYQITEENKKFYEMDKYIEGHNGEVPQGYKGGTTFNNREGKLPVSDSSGNLISYKEFDVNPYLKGVNRGAERLVKGSDGSSYMTSDHYSNFQSLY